MNRSMRIVWIGLGVLVAAVVATNFLLFRSRLITAPDGWSIICPPSDVLAMVVHGDSVLVAGRDGVSVLDRATGLRRSEILPAFAYVRAIAVDSAGTLWVGHEAGLTACRGAERRTFTEQDGLPSVDVTALRLDRAQRLWIGTDQGVVVRIGDQFVMPRAERGLPAERISVLFQGALGEIWIGTNAAPRGGLYILEDPDPGSRESARFFDVAGGLPHNSIADIALGSDSGAAVPQVLVATGLIYEGGVAEFARTPAGSWAITRTLSKADGLAGEKARSILRDRRGMTWCGSEYDGLAYNKGAGWRRLATRDGLPHNEVRSIVEDPDGVLWFGTMNGLVRLDPDAVERLP